MIVEHNIQRPKERQGNRKYPWRDLMVEDSFFVPGVSVERMSSSAVRMARRLGGKFTCCTRTENGQRGVRVWRIA